MLSTRFAPGAPNWVDLGTPDLGAVRAYYGGLFGWETQGHGPEAGDYAEFLLDGQRIAGVGPLTEQGATSAWTVYFHTTDADATAKTVEQAGGTVRLPPMDVFSEGRMAAFTDPAGARFASWQPRDHPGFQRVNAPGTLCWTELHTQEPDASRAFYGTVYGWHAEVMPFAGTTYTVLTLADGGRDTSFGGIMPLAPPAGVPAHWLPYFEVEDCDVTAARSEALGGSIALHPVEAEGVGRFARLTDPCGADFAVITSAT
ncbi:VOC family protein [Streptomyces sp. NPDC048639]|uniref:VOC family protein n=1 Tax=Streptomyces sp. NPDC048639 TaxID=3365581 RepID=UPI0037226085